MTRRILFTFLILIMVSLSAEDDGKSRIKEMVLQWRTPITLFIGFQKSPLTVMFPSKIEAVFSINCVARGNEGQKAEQNNAGFMYDFKANSYFFTVWALKESARGSLNVVFNNRAFTIDLVESQQGYYSTVTLVPSKNQGATQYASTDRATLIGLVEQAKMWQVLKERDDATDDIEYFRPEKELETEFENGDFSVFVREVFRFRRNDTLVFNTIFRNRTEEGIPYDPQMVVAMAGTTRLPQTAIKSSGVMPPVSDTPVWFAIANTRAWTGGRPVQAAQKDWTILVVTEKMRNSVVGSTTTLAEYLRKRSNEVYEAIVVTEDPIELEKLKVEAEKLKTQLQKISKKEEGR